MGVFGDIRGFFGGSGSVFMIIVLAAADHLWGENVFNCPCGGYRVLYTSAFLIVPPVAIIIIDVSWGALCGTLRESCCCECDRNCKGSCCCSCACGQCCKKGCCDCSCCNCKTCETVVRVTARPLIIAVVWLIFSCMEPKFGKCIFETSPCDTDAQRCSATLRVVTAIVMLSLAALAALGGLVFLGLKCCAGFFSCCDCCKGCYQRLPGKCQSCLTKLSESWTEYENTSSNRELTRILYTLGLQPKTVIKLREDRLMDERRLVDLSCDAIKRLGHSISTGQLEILRVHRRDIRLVKWFLQQKCSKDQVRRILVIAENLRTIGAVRDSLNNSNSVDEQTGKALVDELREHNIYPDTEGLAKWLQEQKFSEDQVMRVLGMAENLKTIGAVREALNNSNSVDGHAREALLAELCENQIDPNTDGATEGTQASGRDVQGVANPQMEQGMALGNLGADPGSQI